MAFFILKKYEGILSFGFLPRATAIVIAFLALSNVSYSNCIVSCVQSFNMSLGHNGFYQANPSDLLVDADCNPTDFHVIIFDENGISNGDIIDCQHVGQTVTAQVIETATGNSCSTLIQVFDNLPPAINCQDIVLLCGLPYDPAVLGFPFVYDNCTSLDSSDLSFSDVETNYDCLEIINGDTINAEVQRTWSVVDGNGNPTTCIQNIIFKKSTVWDVVFPPDKNDLVDPSLDCLQDPTDLSLTGEPTIQGIPVSQGSFCDIIVSSNDTEVPHCGSNSFAILRAWTIIDWCTGAFRNKTQIIKVVDSTAPEIVCPQDLTFATDVYDCLGVVQLPMTTATDDCSAFTITPSWVFGTGYGPFEDVPLGTYPVTYTAEDACGNIDTCIIQVTIVDNVPPISICQTSAQFNLGLNGEAIAIPAVFDDGTYDNCGLSHLEISRDAVVFGDSVVLSCDDVLVSPIMLTIRAWDVYGNYNDCEAQAFVNDKLNPYIDCPADITLSCAVDYTNLSLTGQPSYFDNCQVDTVYHADVENTNACSVGEIVRTWTVVDASGHTDECEQIITLIDENILEVTFPENYFTNDCQPQLDTAITGAPIILNKNCELVSVTFMDDTLAQSLPACFVIFRNWQVYDWCNHDPVTEEGYWSFTQVLTVEDTVDPILNIPADTTVFHLSDSCGLYYFNLNGATATDCSPQISIINDSPYASQQGADPSGYYPPGQHEILFYAEDNCGNSNSATFLLTVLDGKEPTAVCGGNISIELNAAGAVSITAADIDGGSFDNCTAPENLQLSVAPSSFSCDDIGANAVTLTVVDEMGLSSTCTATIYIQDNQMACPGGIMNGQALDWNFNGINNVEVQLSGATGDTIYSNLAGEFTKSQLTVGQNVLIKPAKSGAYRDGLSTLDVVLLSRHLIALDVMTNPYQILAGDVDRSGGISPFDLINVQRVILFIDDEFANTNSWRFAPDDHIFPNPSNPFTNEPVEYVAVNDIPDAEFDVNFVGMKLGDVSGNANPSLQSQANLESDPMPIKLIDENGSLQLHFGQELMQEYYGLQLSLPVQLKENAEITCNADLEIAYNYDAINGLLHLSLSSPVGVFADLGRPLIEISEGTTSLVDLEEVKTLTPLYIDKYLTEHPLYLQAFESTNVLQASKTTNK